MMNSYFKSKKVILLVTILALITFATSAITTWINYNTTTNTLMTSLTDIAEGERALIETLHNNGLTKDSILEIIKEKNQSKQSIGKTGEFVIAQMELDSINFICRQDFSGNIKSIKIYSGLHLASPIKLALQGLSGTVKGIDYRDKEVFAGYTYYKTFKWGIVAKINVDEVNKPYYYSLLLTLFFGIIFVFFGSYLFIRITNPMLDSIIKSEERFRSTLDNMMEGCQIIGFDWRYIYLNDAAEIQNRRSKDELLGKKYMNIWPGIENTKVFELEKICMIDRKVQNLINEFEFPDGKIRWFELRIQPVPEGIFILSVDITDRKLADEEISKLNRIYLVLSNVNQAIVRIHDSQKLFEEICRITVENGKFKMVWIGLYNAELNKIEVKNSAGTINGYLDDMNIDLNDKLLSNGPTGRSFKSETHEISNNIINDERMVPWWEIASRNGYKSSAAFPLKIFGKTVGLLNIYSEEINFFNDSEIKLLEEMAMDISFALEFIQNETASKLIEFKLENERIRLKTVIETIPDLIWLKDSNGVYLSCNPRFERFFGAKESEIVGKTDYDFVPKELADFFRQNDKEAQTANKPRVNLEWVTFADDGHKEFLETIKTPMFDSQGVLIGILGISRNITEQHQALDDLRLTSERLRVSLKNSNIVVAITNADLRYEWIYNTQPEFPADKVIGLRDDEIAQNEGAVDLMQMKKQILETGKDIRKEITFLNGNIEETFDITGEPLFDSEGKIAGVTTASLNITDRKKVEQQLIKALKKAEESDRLKSNFLANMSHELRTPMVGILGFSQLLFSADDMEEVYEMANLILSSGKRLMETLNLILDLSSIEAGEAGLELINFDVISVIKNSINNFIPLALKKNLSIILNCNLNELQVHSSRKAVDSVLNNLISNAVKFTNEGTINIKVNFESKDFADWFVIEIADTGIGIEEKDFVDIFKEFRQVSEGFGRNYEGTGLGLTLTKKFTEILGGTISIKSKINKGTTFIVSLPVFSLKTNIMLSNMHKSYESTNKQLISSVKSIKKVLIVEDDEISNLLIRKYLAEICEIDSVVNAKEAIEKAENFQFDAIFMDINLGKSANGIYATQQIRNLENYWNIPIVAMTAYAMKGDKEEFLSEGCSHYISKPFDKDELIKLVYEVLEIQSVYI